MKIELPGLALIAGGTMLACAVVYSCWPVKPKVPAPVLTGVNGTYTLEASVDGKSHRWTNSNGQYAIVYDPHEASSQSELSNAWMDGAGWGFTLTHLVCCSTNRDFRADSEMIMREATHWNPYRTNQ